MTLYLVEILDYIANPVYINTFGNVCLRVEGREHIIARYRWSAE